MAFGELTVKMSTILSLLVPDKTVYDWGGGDKQRAKMLSTLGAKEVISVDKEYKESKQIGNIHYVRDYFKAIDTPEVIDISCLFWPTNSSGIDDVLPHLRKSRIVIYLGKNDNTTSCGSKALWEYLKTREVFYIIQHSRNDLIVYGPKAREDQASPRDEFNAIQSWSQVWKMN